MNDILPPQLLRVALTKVIVNYLGIRGLLTADGRQFAGISYLLDVLPPSINSPSRPIAHLLVDIGTFEARVVVAVIGASIARQSIYHVGITFISDLDLDIAPLPIGCPMQF